MSYNRERINEVNPDAYIWDDMDDAIVGISNDGRVIYDIYKMECLVYEENKENMTFDEAVEWVDYNVLSAYLGEFTPIHIWTIPNTLDNKVDLVNDELWDHYSGLPSPNWYQYKQELENE